MKNSLRYYRKKAGITLEELASSSGVARSTIGNVETGTTRASAEFWKKMERCLSISCKMLQSPPIGLPGIAEDPALSRPGFSHQGNAERIKEDHPESHWERRALNAEAKLEALTAAMEALLNRFKMR